MNENDVDLQAPTQPSALIINLPGLHLSVQNPLLVQTALTDQMESLSQHPVTVYLSSLAPGSRRTMQCALNTLASMIHPSQTAMTLPWSKLRFQHTAALQTQLRDRYATATANKMLCALRGVLKNAWKLGQLTAEEYQSATSITSLIGETLPAGRNVANNELSSFLKICQQDPTAAGARDAAILSILYGCGLRRSELTALDVEDLIRLDSTLKILGKRNKARTVPVVGSALRALEDWLATRGTEPGPLFVRIQKGGAVQIQARLTTQAIYHILHTRAEQAGVDHFSPHDLRRTFVGDLLDAGADIVTVQRLAGHAAITTTSRYDRRGEATKRKAAELLPIPYYSRQCDSELDS